MPEITNPDWPEGWINPHSPAQVELDNAYTGDAAEGIGGAGQARGIMGDPIPAIAITAEVARKLAGPQESIGQN
jgi:hypothetical protein